MKIGCCGSFAERKMLEDIGFDFMEANVQADLVPLAGQQNFLESFARGNQSSLPVYAFNSFLPGQLKVCGPEIDLKKLENYVSQAIKRAREAGGRIIVFGSGGARNVPEGFSRDKAWEQLITFLQMAAEQAAGTGITIAVEHLRSAESNIINSVESGLKLAQEVARPEVIKVLVDIYHLEEENESYEHILEVGDLLAHVHLADTGRYYPGSGNYNYQRLMEILNEINYNGGLSIECKWQDKEEEAKKALNFLREMVEK